MNLSYRSPLLAIQLAESGSVNEDIQLFRTGTFYHEKYGKFDITPQVLQAMEKNFKANVRGVDLAVDYKHENNDIAAGWIKEVYLKGNELWAKVDWTPTGSKVLAEKEFRYISPEFLFNYQDNESLKKFGPVLLGAGLTNRPTIKKMEPVVLSEYQPKLNEEEMKMNPEQIDQMSIEELKALCKKLLADKAPEPEAPKPEMDMEEMKKKLADAEKKLADAEQAKACSEKKSQFAVLLSEGKVCKAQEQSYLDGDMVKFISLSSPLKLNEQEQGTGQTPAQAEPVQTKEQAEDKALELAETLMKTNKSLSLSDALKSVLSENEELQTKIYG